MGYGRFPTKTVRMMVRPFLPNQQSANNGIRPFPTNQHQQITGYGRSSPINSIEYGRFLHKNRVNETWPFPITQQPSNNGIRLFPTNQQSTNNRIRPFPHKKHANEIRPFPTNQQSRNNGKRPFLTNQQSTNNGIRPFPTNQQSTNNGVRPFFQLAYPTNQNERGAAVTPAPVIKLENPAE
jgi:hypothetical protein